MDQRKRMYRMLGCLAGAMTGTAALLAWFDPSPSPPRTLSQEGLTATARSLVFVDVPLRPGQRRQVEIVDGPSSHSAGAPLSAGAERSKPHFYVDDEGQPSRSRR